MGFLDRVLAAFRREKAEAADLLEDTEARLDADLARRERELAESPEERLARLQQEIGAQDDPFAEVRRKIARTRGGADIGTDDAT